MSSKNRKKYPFNASSQTPEKYLDSFDRAKSGETSAPSGDDELQEKVMSTDAPLGNIITPPPDTKSRGIPKWLTDILKTVGHIMAVVAVVGLLVSICIFFINMNSSVQKTNDEIREVKSNVEKIDVRIERSNEETSKNQNEFKISLMNLINKVERLFDKK